MVLALTMGITLELAGPEREASVMVRLVCPYCRGPLSESNSSSWRCATCRQDFRGLRGIPDLRTSDDAYRANDDDWSFACRLNESFDDLDFRGLLQRYYELSPDVPPELRQRQIEHILGATERTGIWLSGLGMERLPSGTLDLGCGSGPFWRSWAGRASRPRGSTSRCDGCSWPASGSTRTASDRSRWSAPARRTCLSWTRACRRWWRGT